MVEIKGLEKFGPKDYPGFISSTLFVGGCNFRCPFCHNAELVLKPDSLPSFPLDYIHGYLDSRKGWLEAEWRQSPTGRAVRFYELTAAGREQLEQQSESWDRYVSAMYSVLRTAEVEA